MAMNVKTLIIALHQNKTKFFLTKGSLLMKQTNVKPLQHKPLKLRTIRKNEIRNGKSMQCKEEGSKVNHDERTA